MTVNDQPSPSRTRKIFSILILLLLVVLGESATIAYRHLSPSVRAKLEVMYAANCAKTGGRWIKGKDAAEEGRCG